MDVTISLDELKKHPDLWWEDGNVVLVAENSGFKVHRSVVSRRSSVLKDMFSLPAFGAQVTFEDVPIVHLSDDPEELAYFLDAMYNGLQYRVKGRTPLSWIAIKALLVIGDKYGVDEFYQEVLSLVEEEYPKDMLSWNVIRQITKSCFRDPFTVIDLVGVARRLRLRDIYLTALYDCCNLETEVLVNGAASTMGSKHVKLEPRDLITVLSARTALNEACNRAFKSILSFPNNRGCRSNCHIRRDKVAWRWAVEDMNTAYDPLGFGIENNFKKFAQEYDFCEICISHYGARYRDRQQDIRDHLDAWMDVKISAEEFDA